MRGWGTVNEAPLAGQACTASELFLAALMVLLSKMVRMVKLEDLQGQGCPGPLLGHT